MVRTSRPTTIGIAAAGPAAGGACADAIERAGGVPWLVPHDRGLSKARGPLDADGLLVYGDEDAGPGPESDQPPRAHDAHSRPGTDSSLLALLEAALRAGIPVLCVGRGMHILNEAMGGAPTRDVQGHAGTPRDDDGASAYHRIFLAPGSKLASVVGSGGFVRVNSRHRRGVKEPQKSPQLMASAYGLDDGVIEGLESPAHRWVIGVQFHPERRREVPPQFDRLFKAHVEQANRFRNTALH